MEILHWIDFDRTVDETGSRRYIMNNILFMNCMLHVNNIPRIIYMDCEVCV